VLTNNHVIDGASQIQVTVVTTGDTYSADVVGADPSNDVAVIRLSGASGLATIPLGDSDSVKVGDPIVAIGNAGGRGGTPSVVTGNVTALHQQITASDATGNDTQTLTDTIQVNADVQPGDSGGPLVDAGAKVVGINSAAAPSTSRRKAAAHQGFAIPINRALSIAKNLEANPSQGGSTAAKKPLLGVQVTSGTGSGATVAEVQANSPAAAAGLKRGDVIVGFDDTTIGSAQDLTAALRDHQPGDTVTVTWKTAGRTHDASITLGSR